MDRNRSGYAVSLETVQITVIADRKSPCNNLQSNGHEIFNGDNAIIFNLSNPTVVTKEIWFPLSSECLNKQTCVSKTYSPNRWRKKKKSFLVVSTWAFLIYGENQSATFGIIQLLEDSDRLSSHVEFPKANAKLDMIIQLE